MSVKVSVVVATYRRDDALRRALDSLKTQSFEDFEIVITDDNADKDWNEKVSKIVSDFSVGSDISCLLITNEQNKGSAESRNIGIDRANGEYITFLDDDDVYLPEKIKNQYNAILEKQGDYSLTNIELRNDDETLSEIRNRDYTEKEDLLTCHLKYHMTGTDTMMFKKEYLKKIGGFDPIDVGDEYYLMMKAINNGGKFVYAPFCDVKAYVHKGEGGLSSGQKKIDGENALYEFKKKYFQKLSKKDVRYIKMRHHAVLAFAFYRSGNLFGFFKEGVRSFFSGPVSCVKLLVGRNI